MKNFLTIEIPDSRNFGLDIMRSIAILFVLVSHSLTYLPVNISEKLSTVLIDGVAVFFVLSGFLIGTIMLKSFQKRISFHDLFLFWLKRWLRTLPLYFFILTILIITGKIKDGSLSHIPLYKYYFFIQNFNNPIYDFFPESWSLSVEEWFYFLFPLLLLTLSVFMRSKKFLFLAVIILLLVSITGLRFYRYFNLETKSYFVYDRYFLREVTSRLDAIVYGVFAAWLRFYYNSIWNRLKLHRNIICFTAAFVIVLVTYYERKNDLVLYLFSFTFISIAIALTLPFFERMSSSKSQYLNDSITRLSIISYSLYLVNLNLVSFYFLNSLNVNSYIKFILFWLITFLLSILTYKYIEKPVMDYRSKLMPKRVL